jgi:hypothetical protein
MGWLIGSILSLAVLAVGILVSIEDPSGNNSVAIVFTFILSLIFFKKYRDSKNGVSERRKEEKVRRKEEKIKGENEKKEKLKLIPGTKERVNELGAIRCISAMHMAGLPLAEGAACYIYLCEDKIIFERNETKINLLMNKINDIMIKTNTEIEKEYVSSAGGAIGGAMLFGPLGAMIGGRVKEKKTTIINKYIIFSYDKDGTNEFISFDVTGSIEAIKFVQFFYNIPKEKREINFLKSAYCFF